MLAFLGVCWFVIGFCYVFMSESRRWQPDLVGYLAFGTSAATFAFVARPWDVWAFRLAGTLGVGCLLFRMASVVMGLFGANDVDAIYITTSGTATTAMLLAFYWTWWLRQVQVWHEEQKALKRARDEGLI